MTPGEPEGRVLFVRPLETRRDTGEVFYGDGTVIRRYFPAKFVVR